MLIIKNIERYNSNDNYEQNVVVVVEDSGYSRDLFVTLSHLPGIIEFMNKQDFKIYIKTDMELLKANPEHYTPSRYLSYEIFFKKEEHYQSFINDYVVIEKLAK